MQPQAAPIQKLKYEAFQDNQNQADWRVECLDMKAGDVYVAIFSGPLAKERASEYADFKNKN